MKIQNNIQLFGRIEGKMEYTSQDGITLDKVAFTLETSSGSNEWDSHRVVSSRMDILHSAMSAEDGEFLMVSGSLKYESDSDLAYIEAKHVYRINIMP